ncbi:MAG: choice-of-anchor L domain-containing protein, partial [Chitinophagales bacterium]
VTYTVSSSTCDDSHSEIIYVGEPAFPSWTIEGGNNDICKTDLPIAVFSENEGGAWCCEDFLNCNATDENCFTTTDGQVYFDPIIDLNNAVETYELSYVTSFENCNTHITKTINIYAPPSIPEVSQPNQIFCLGEVTDAFLFVSTPLVYSDQFFTFNVYDESGTLLISTVKPNEDMIDFTNWLVNSGTYTFSITTVNGTCESEGVEVSFLVEDCSSDLNVEIATNCTVDEEGVYGLYISILGGTPPFTISGSIEETLEGFEATSTLIPHGMGYELFVVDAIGDEFSKIVIDSPCPSLCDVNADFIPSANVLCINESIEFLNLSENAMTYEWLVDGIAVSTDFDLFYTFDVAGDYTVTLNAIDGDCSNTFEETFTLLDCSQIEAVNDTVYLWTVSDITPFRVSFNILENDLGEIIELREVFYDEDINVGEYLSFAPNGDILFEPTEAEGLTDVISYQIEDVNGKTAVADLVLIIDVISESVDSDSSLVASILGECMSFENATVTGVSTAYTKIDAFQLDFAAGVIGVDASELPFSEGVLLTTGSGLDGILSPNTIGSLGTNNESEGDIDLANEGEETFDACALEFDFTAISESISFPYWFGSEEYLGGEFPDRMAIFISGGEYTEPTNIAVLPDTNVPIGVETVNEIENKDYFVANAPKTLPQYDGLTIPLEAIANLDIGETYHIKIVIADVGDAVYDSGLFIKANMSAEDLDLEVSNDVLINQGESTELSAEVLNTTANVVYDWSPSETLDDVNSATPMATPSETTTYYVTANLGNCEFMDSVLVTVAEVIPCEGLSAGTLTGVDPYVCFGANVGGDISLTAEGFELRTGDVLGYVLQDASGTSLAYSSVDANFSFEDLDSPFYNTEYFVSAVVGVDNGSGAVDFEGECVKYSEAFPVVFLEKVILTSNIVCDNNDEFRIEVSATGGLPSYLQDSTYHLPQYGLSFLQSETVDLGPFNNGEVIDIELIDDRGCTSISTVEHNGLAIFVGGTEVTNGSWEINFGESIGLTVITDEGTTFDWTPSETLDDADASNPTANPTETTTYTLTAIVNDGCELTAMVTITVLSEDPCAGLSAGTLSLTEPYYVCFGDKIGGDTPVLAEGSSVTEGHVLGYVLQDAEGVTLAYRSANANFGFGEITNAEYNTEYFVSAVVGTDDGGGSVDFEGECIFYSDSVSVVFLQQIILSTNILCENNETFSVEVSAMGGLPAFLNTELYTVVASGQTFFIDGNIEVGPFGNDELADIEVVDDNGCEGTVMVENYELSIFVEGLDLTSDTLIISQGESISLVGTLLGTEQTAIIDYTWFIEENAISQLPTLGTTPDTSGVYNLMVEIDGNCTLTANITVLVLPTAQDCVDAIVVCDTEPIYYNSDGEGVEEIDGLIEAGCLGNGGEYHSTWFRLQIDTATAANELLLFTISPNDGKEDYDFALYKSNDCGNLDEPIRCTAAPPSIESANTGLRLGATDTVEVSAMDDGFVKPVSVNDGEVYYLLVNNFAGNLQGFKLEWTGNVVFNCIPTPDCAARGGELSLNQTDYCDESNISVTWTWEEENDLLKHHYVLAADENTIIPIDTIGTFCRVGLNYEPGINPNDYTTIDEIEAAIDSGLCMALSNIVCFDVFEVPDVPTLLSKECDHELLHLNVNALQDATISWYAGDTLFVEGNDVHIEVAGTYSVSQTLNDCESNSLEVVVSEADLVCLGDCPENLVQNYSFEEFEICPDFGASIREANFWRSPLGTAFEADYFNECNSAPNSYGVPQNLYGTQSTIPPEEMAYAGIVAYNGLDNDITKREFLQTELTDTLIEGQTYCVSMQVSLAESSQFAINNLGIYFSDSQINGTDIEGVLNPQIQHPAFLTDTVNWMEIQGTFKATAELKHLIIGNFDPNNGTALVNENGNGQAYYYIDMIQIRPINEIEGFTVFNQDNEELEVVDNTVIVCPKDTTIRMEAIVSSTNYACDLGWGNSVDSLVPQTSFTVSALESDTMTVYPFWVSNGFCDIADSLVVVLGELDENGDCVLSVCSGAEALMNALQNVGVDLPYSRTAMEVQSMDLEDLVRYELSQLAENTVGFDSNLLADFEVNMLMNSLQTACDPTRLQILPNSIVYDNSDPSNYAYIGEDQLTYTVSFPDCETVTQTLRVNIQCP